MDISGWVRLTREDGEAVGYVEPVTADYGVVQPRNLLGHCVGGPVDFVEAEDLLVKRGISELAARWVLSGAGDEVDGDVAILEVSPDGIVVAPADLAKVGTHALRVRVDWPDVAGVLRRSATDAP